MPNRGDPTGHPGVEGVPGDETVQPDGAAMRDLRVALAYERNHPQSGMAMMKLNRLVDEVEAELARLLDAERELESIAYRERGRSVRAEEALRKIKAMFPFKACGWVGEQSLKVINEALGEE